ncbi:hypothetical protein [Herpetosiphon sp. NSE202]|uniref:hypothetical protein n=1 Tax=Herpetosiphon sp. NSE202 TaxID=3351349 RepID=UPI0036424233
MQHVRRWCSAVGLLALALSPIIAQAQEPQAISAKNQFNPPAHDPFGVTTINQTNPKSSETPDIYGALASGSAAQCGSGIANWTTTSAALIPIVSCSLTFSEPGFVYLAASASLGIASESSSYEALFRLGADSISGDPGTDRWVNIYTDSSDGTDKNLAVSKIVGVTAGTHTFYFLGSRFSASGTVNLYNPILSVLYFPNSSPIKACNANLNGNWTTSSETLTEINSCSLNLPQAGHVYMNANASASFVNQAYEVETRLAIDTTNVAGSYRWTNIEADTGDGTDESVATSQLMPVTSGTHTFKYLAGRSTGTGTVNLFDPSLSIIYFPAGAVTALRCGQGGAGSWSSAVSTFSPLASCSMQTGNGVVFMDGNASAGLNAPTDAAWEGLFRFSIDGIGLANTDRWLNVYPDSGDGTDRVINSQGLALLPQGVHSFAFTGRRYAGTGTVHVFRPALIVLASPTKIFIPAAIK